jgi:hypothetical protein
MAAVAMGFVIALGAGLMNGAVSVAYAARPAIVEYIGPFALDFPFLDCGDYWMWHRYTLSGTVKAFESRPGVPRMLQIRVFLDDYLAYNPAHPDGPYITGHSGNASEEHYIEQIKFDNDGRAIRDQVAFKGLHLVMPGWGRDGLRIYAGRMLYLPVDPDHSGPTDPWYLAADTGVRFEGDPATGCDYLR